MIQYRSLLEALLADGASVADAQPRDADADEVRQL
jgi:hypothetical protein